MNLAQIRHKAEMYCGVPIADDVLLSVVNEALEKIGDLAFIDDEIQVTAENPNEWIELPDTTTRIMNVTKDGKVYQEWQSRGYKVKFAEPGNYVVAVERTPKEVEEITDTPECHVLFHRVIVDYLRGTVKLMKDDNNQDGHRLVQKFDNEIARVAAMIQNNRKR